MARRRGDLTNQRFGRLLVIGRAEDQMVGKRKESAWLCVCDCGVQKIMPGRGLMTDKTASCGCIRKSLEYASWYHMRQRCNYEKNHHYSYYGGRGITVCERWNVFENFYTDMGPRPSASHTLDRIDTNGNYEPDNCRWATKKEQQRNRRVNVLHEYQGRQCTLAELAEIAGIHPSSLRKRLKRGASVEDAVSRPKKG